MISANSSNNSSNPKVSIVTPSFNQAAYLEKTIQSVLNQTYKNIEYIVIDGGSTDGSPDIIGRYQNALTYWHTRKDRGAADAINQGWSRATGDIFAYLNSDDLLTSDAVRTVVSIFHSNPEADVVYGDAVFIDSQGQELGPRPSERFDHATVFRTWVNPIVQPSCFFSRKIFEAFGGLDESYEFALDFEYWLRICEAANFLYVPVCLSAVRLHKDAKTWRLEGILGSDLLRMGLRAIENGMPARHGVAEQDARKGLYLRAADHLRNGGMRTDAVKAFWSYCRAALPFPFSVLRLAKFSGGVFVKDTFHKKPQAPNSIDPLLR